MKSDGPGIETISLPYSTLIQFVVSPERSPTAPLSRLSGIAAEMATPPALWRGGKSRTGYHLIP